MTRTVPFFAVALAAAPAVAQPEPEPEAEPERDAEEAPEADMEAEPPAMPDLDALDEVLAEAEAELAEEELGPSETSFELEPPEAEAPLFAMDVGALTLAPHALLQVGLVPWIGDDGRIAAGDAANVEGFVLRRARLGLEGTVSRDVRASVWLEIHDSESTEGDARLLDASLAYAPRRYLSLALGVGKVPFSKGWTTEARLLQLPERPFALRQLDVRPIVPDRELGGWVTGDLEIASYAVGVFNGSTGLTEGDDNAGLRYAARLEITPLGTTGPAQPAFFPEETGHGRLRVAVGGDVYFNDDAAGDQLAWSADLTVKWRGLSLLGEYLESRFEPDDVPVVPVGGFASVDQRAVYGQVGYFLLPGLFESAVRVEWLDRDLDATTDPGVLALTVGLNYYFVGHRLKAMATYTHRREPDAPSGGQAENDSAVLLVQGAF